MLVSSDETGNRLTAVTGGVKNSALVTELAIAAREHQDSISFVYCDGIAHSDRFVEFKMIVFLIQHHSGCGHWAYLAE